MLLIVLAALALQDPPPAAAGTVAWDAAVTAPPAPEAPPAVLPPIPDWALADPFAWERAQCSPSVRKDATLEACQGRVRADLAAHLGDRLPAALRPDAIQECRRTADGFAVDCGAPQRPDRPLVVPREQDCGTRMTRSSERGAVFNTECRPAVGEERREDGVSIRVFGRD